MYTKDQLYRLPGDSIFKIVTDLHCALIALLWLIDKRECDSPYYDAPQAIERANEVHRRLVELTARQYVETADETVEKDFRSWYEGNGVGEQYCPLLIHKFMRSEQ
jgi:hypothetical protein